MILSFVFLATAAFFNAICDKLRTRYNKTVFSRLKRGQKWFNPKLSHKNKKHKNPAIQFVLSTMLVPFTDAWHFFKALWLISFVSITFTAGPLLEAVSGFTTVWDFVKLFTAACLLWMFVFEFTYNSDYGK